MRIPDNANVIDSGYCNPDEWEVTKRKQLDKHKEKYPEAKCVLVPSDTRGLRMWVTYSMYFK